jgi:hypothetical protein
VLNHLPGDSGHIRYFPSENINIFLEKSDKHKFLFGEELVANLELLFRFIGIRQNFLVVLLLQFPFF